MLYFFPKAFTKGCTAEAHEFAEAAAQFKAAGATLIGMSADDIGTLHKFSTQECSSKFPVAADPDLKVIKAYELGVMRSRQRQHRRPHLLCDRAGRQDRLRLFRPQSRQARREHAGRGQGADEEVARHLIFQDCWERVPKPLFLSLCAFT